MVLRELAQRWELLKDTFVPNDTALRSLLHVHAGMAIYLAIALVMPRKLASVWPLLAASAATLAVEGLDLAALHNPDRFWIIYDTAIDILNSLLWPSLIFLFARFMEADR